MDFANLHSTEGFSRIFLIKEAAIEEAAMAPRFPRQLYQKFKDEILFLGISSYLATTLADFAGEKTLTRRVLKKFSPAFFLVKLPKSSMGLLKYYKYT